MRHFGINESSDHSNSQVVACDRIVAVDVPPRECDDESHVVYLRLETGTTASVSLGWHKHNRTQAGCYLVEYEDGYRLCKSEEWFAAYQTEVENHNNTDKDDGNENW